MRNILLKMRTGLQKNQQGFTLFELLIYVSLISILAVVFVNFAIDINTTAKKTVVRQEVQESARFSIERMMQEIRRAQGINVGTSTFDTHPGVLSLQMANPAEDPTVFDISGGVLRIKQGAGAAEDLTPASLTVASLVFTNLTVGDRTSNIKATITVAHPNPSNIETFDAEVTLQSAAAVRQLED